MDNFDKYIGDQVQSDKLAFTPDERIHDRLMYHMQLRSSQSAVRKNQILPWTGNLFTGKFLSWKVGIAAAFLIFFMGYRQFSPKTTHLHIIGDTTTMVQSVDTTHTMIGDSVMVN